MNSIRKTVSFCKLLNHGKLTDVQANPFVKRAYYVCNTQTTTTKLDSQNFANNFSKLFLANEI